ncbi:hypothetical protein B0H19DRAFT_1068763 [Mycena capillaripes]|nr:hypothetical protein B0H19DRAFT_1068763 [Mycena capillaripes]
MGFFTGMMTQFMREAMVNGTLPALPGSTSGNTASAASPLPPLPTISIPPAIPYSSTRSQSIALPAAPTGHPLPSNNLSTFSTMQPMLGMAGLGIPLTGHSNNARPRRSRRRVRDLSPTQISDSNATRRTAAAAHLGPTGVALQLRNRRTRGPAVRGPVLEAPGSLLEQVSFVDAAGVRQIKLTNLVQAFQPGQEVTFYKNYGSSFSRYLQESHLSFSYTIAETTKVTAILEMTAVAMRTGPRNYAFGPIPPGPSTAQQHERLDLQVLAFVNTGKNRGAGSAHLRRAPEVNATLTLQDLFRRPWKNLFTVPTLCIQDGRLVLHSIIRYDGVTFVEDSVNRSLPLRHHCLGARQTRQFTEAVEMNVDDSDSGATETSGGVPTDNEDDDEDMPMAPTISQASTSPQARPVLHPAELGTLLSTAVQMVPTQVHQTQHVIATPATACMDLVQQTMAIAPHWGALNFTAPASGPYRALFDRADVPAAVYQAVGGTGRLDLEANSLHNLAMLYIARIRTASANRDFSPLLCPRRKFKVQVKFLGSTESIPRQRSRAGDIYTALNIFLADAGQWFVPTDEGRLTLAISMPLRLASAIAPSRLENLRVLGALVSLSLISGKPPGPVTPALLQYALNDRRLESLTPDFVATWHPSVARVARAMQAIGPQGSLLPFQNEIINFLNIQISALSQRDENQHNTLVNQLVHNAVLGPEIHGHPEAGAFFSGVELQCADGFSFVKARSFCPSFAHWTNRSQLARSYPGGVDFYLAHAWTSQIVDFYSVERLLVISEPDRPSLIRDFGLDAPVLDAEGRFLDFLKRTGNPCPALLEDGKSHFDPAVIDELPNIDLPSFRPRMFCWATTGSPFLDPDPNFDSHDPMVVHFVLPGDAFYNDDPATSAAIMAQGLISFRTCSRTARIPISKLLQLYSVVYPTPDASTFEDAIDNWFLLQILNAIGKVSML